MATIRLIPSAYTLSSTSYLSVSNASNMYSNTDDTTYATVTNSRTSTSSYYIYLHDFNFSDIPSNAIINSFSVKLKAYESGVSTSTTYRPYLVANGNTSTSVTSGDTYGYCNALSTSATTQTFTILGEWEDIVAEGNDLSIRINCRRASRNTTSYVYIYGAEIEVDYTIPTPAVVTSTLTGDGTIDPSGATTTYQGAEYTLTITPTNKSDTVTIKNNGVDVSSQLVVHGVAHTSDFTASDVTTSDIQSGSSYAEYAVGYSAENYNSSGEDRNMYASSSSTGYAQYSFDFSDIPSNVNIESVEAVCYGHRESSTISSTYVSQCVLMIGSSQASEEVDFPSTSDTTITIPANVAITRSQLDNLTLRHYVGYYGGLVLGITLNVTYSTGDSVDHYTYTFTVDDNATIAVTIGSQETSTLYLKVNDQWVTVAKAYKKISGSWVEQDITTLFNTSTKYVRR